MDHIVIPVSSLCNLAKELKEDHMDYVELTILDPDEEDDAPACLSPSAFKSSDSDMQIEYDSIDHVTDYN